MGKENWIYKFLKKIGLIKQYELTFEQKAEMCSRACRSGICPKDCDRCAWGVLK